MSIKIITSFISMLAIIELFMLSNKKKYTNMIIIKLITDMIICNVKHVEVS